MFYEVTRPALRRVRLREELPTDHPAILDDVAGLLDNLPDPALLCAEQRAGSMASLATLRNRIKAYLTAVAGEADKAADSRVLGAGTTGMLVAVATCSNPAAGSAIVNRAAVLESLPGVAAGFAAGALSTAHVATIVDAGAHLPGLDTYEQPLAEAAAHIEPLELKRMLDALVAQERPTMPLPSSASAAGCPSPRCPTAGSGSAGGWTPSTGHSCAMLWPASWIARAQPTGGP